MNGTVAAVDLGGTSGRVVVGRAGPRELSLQIVSRFPNQPVHLIDGLHWNILELYRNVQLGLEAALRDAPEVRSIAVDSWGVDYGLLSNNRIVGSIYHYRNERNLAAQDAVHRVVSPSDLYQANGIQQLPFNTVYQLWADAATGALDGIDTFLLIPDLINFWLTGRQVAERTNASTTGLLDPVRKTWNDDMIGRLDLPRRLFPELIDAGDEIGPLLPDVATTLGSVQGQVTVTAVGSHDTASAVVAVPATSENFAYISCGTWGLVGVELTAPVLTEESRLAHFTNEAGVDGRVRFLHNVMGLWLVNECVREWEQRGEPVDLPGLIERAAAIDHPVPVFDASDTRFLSPGNMQERIIAYFTERGEAAPVGRIELIRSIFESLAASFANAVETACALSGSTASVVHIVGGGSENDLLCQLTADRLGRPVLAGPAEATSLGNILVQARSQGFVTGSLESLRNMVATAFAPRVFHPRRSRKLPGTSVASVRERTIEQ